MPPLRALVLALCVAAPTAASAQVVNVFARAPGVPAKGVHGDLDLSADWRSGNVDFFDLEGALSGSWHRKRQTLLVAAEGEHVFASNQLVLEHTLESVRYRYRANDYISPEAFVEHQYTPFRRLALRLLVGVDLRFAVRFGAHFGLSFGFGLMGEHQVLLPDGGPSAGQITDDLRYTTYLAFATPLGTHLFLEETALLRDRQDDGGNLRLRSSTTVYGRVNDWLRLGVILTAVYDTRPPPGVLPGDTSFESAMWVDI